jgi:hypothetical protein
VRAFGSGVQMKEDGVTMGHTLFTYVHSDDFNAEHEVHRTVSTSTGERMQHLVRRLLGKTANPTMVRAALRSPGAPGDTNETRFPPRRKGRLGLGPNREPRSQNVVLNRFRA